MAKIAKKQSRVKIIKPYKSLIAGVTVTILSFCLLLWRLANLTNNKISYSELLTKKQLLTDSPWWKSISYIYGPYFSLEHATFAIDHHSVLAFRLTSIIIGTISVGIVFWIVNQWHGYKIALLTAAVYATNLGFLILSRQALVLTAQLLMIISLLMVMIILPRWHSWWSLATLIIIASGDLYLPGGIWLVLATLIICQKDIRQTFSHLSLYQKILLPLIQLLAIIPLAYRLISYYSNHQLIHWLGYNLSAPKEYFHNLASSVLDLFIHSNLTPNLSLGHQPLIDVAISIIILLGFYCYIRHISSYRWRSYLILTLLSLLLCGFGIVSAFALIPLLMVAAGTGLAYLLREWYAIFPLNPFARHGGFILMSIIVLFSCFYGVRSYFVAWANDPINAGQYSYHLH